MFYVLNLRTNAVLGGYGSEDEATHMQKYWVRKDKANSVIIVVRSVL